MELFQRIEHLIGKKLPVFPTQDEEVMMLTERVNEAQRFARMVRVFAFPASDALTCALIFTLAFCSRIDMGKQRLRAHGKFTESGLV